VRALFLAVAVLLLAGCASAPGVTQGHRFVGHELTLSSLSEPVLVFEGGAFYAESGCQSIRGRYTLDGARLQTSAVSVTGPVDCRSAESPTLFSRVLTSPTLIVEKDDGTTFSIVSNAGRLSLDVGPAVSSGVGESRTWSFLSGTDTTGTFVDYRPRQLQLSVGTAGETQDTRIERSGTLHTFDGCVWIGTYRYTGDLALETVPTPGVDVQDCGTTGSQSSADRYRFSVTLGAATSAWHSAHLLLVRGASGSLLFRISTST
jgi:hypothetical protein